MRACVLSGALSLLFITIAHGVPVLSVCLPFRAPPSFPSLACVLCLICPVPSRPRAGSREARESFVFGEPFYGAVMSCPVLVLSLARTLRVCVLGL